jgi:hypothetical protein
LINLCKASVGVARAALLFCSLVASCANYTEQELKAGAVQIRTAIRHKYAQDVPVSIKFEMGGEPPHSADVVQSF